MTFWHASDGQILWITNITTRRWAISSEEYIIIQHEKLKRDILLIHDGLASSDAIDLHWVTRITLMTWVICVKMPLSRHISPPTTLVPPTICNQMVPNHLRRGKSKPPDHHYIIKWMNAWEEDDESWLVLWWYHNSLDVEGRNIN